MISGIPSVPAFVIGLAAGIALYWAKLPAMMVGLGVYLPFYMSLTAFLGALAKLAYDAAWRRKNAATTTVADDAELERLSAEHEQNGLVVASGVLGGESIVGVVIAFASVIMGLAA